MKLKTFFINLLFVLLISQAFGQAPTSYNNPILPGYHPDPSICRVGDDYYLVNSSFVWFPGLPIYHSKDLVNWEHIGYGITNSETISFNGLKDKHGLFAPTIRHHNGTFYIINTCVGCKMNFYITATNPAGPWSDPIWLPSASGIDPSLFWDEDGKSYYTGMESVADKKWSTQTVVYNQEIDLNTNQLIGKRHHLTFGHANNAAYAEGPHIYKINGKYILLLSEGGTEQYHAMSVHHSDSINGPYQADIINPVLTHRHLGKDYPIYAVGHGDLVKTQNGEWWAVVLGKRLNNGITTLARETFLAKVEFEGQTPIFNKGKGVVLSRQKRPDLPWTPFPAPPKKDDFTTHKIDLRWCSIRTPEKEFYKLNDGKLKLNLHKEVLDSLVHSSMLIQRIVDHNFEASTAMSFSTSKINEESGLCLYRTNENHFTLMKNDHEIILTEVFKGNRKVIAKVKFGKKNVILKAKAQDMMIQFYIGESSDHLIPIGPQLSLITIADGQGNAQFNGAGIGIYATSNGQSTKNKAHFDWFQYNGLDLDTTLTD
ncbi:glycoside hydrolase family 43 protein [Flammeovirga pacifica]|uniref:Glycoside hydrolase 43 family protein n=1 Tax=Flammeovirga pacifica TaxID=915059 RepID=A0A1S1Z012_FLAPC|nr:glycoside hydrolase family 43 protein [Flammeovirga pacifica]OHX66604.1 glycoside hydrolase 43 family protein [Flammeovirga pacifica]